MAVRNRLPGNPIQISEDSCYKHSDIQIDFAHNYGVLRGSDHPFNRLVISDFELGKGERVGGSDSLNFMGRIHYRQ